MADGLDAKAQEKPVGEQPARRDCVLSRVNSRQLVACGQLYDPAGSALKKEVARKKKATYSRSNETVEGGFQLIVASRASDDKLDPVAESIVDLMKRRRRS